MQLTRKCFGCKQDTRKDEMIEYASPSAKTMHWYCRKCYEDKLARERFSNKVCEIFGIKSPGPIIWTQRKKLRETYGYTDDTIVDCLDYIYTVEKKRILSESLVLVKPYMVDRMKQWKNQQRAKAGSLAAAVLNTKMTEHLAPIRESKSKKTEINLEDALFED